MDEIVNKILHRPELSDCILDILNMCFASKTTIPNEWHISLLVPVFKKGNISLCTNYRSIALMSACAKLYNRLLLGRIIRDGLDTHLQQNQNSFCPLRSTGKHVLAWRRRIYEEVIATKFASLFSTFIDFSKVFDSVDWNYIENIMLSYDIPVEIVDAVMSVCNFLHAVDFWTFHSSDSPFSLSYVIIVRYCSVKYDTNRLIMGQLALLMSDVYISQRETYLHSIRTDIEALTGDNQAKHG